DTSANIIESIWPTPAPQNASSKVLPLKVFIQEILRRSKTSFSTLQLALFYIIRLRNQIEATKNEIRVHTHVAGEPLPACGRRVFLTALILASKYLQDRNYSNKAWSKISGLAVSEINANEFQFLSLINYDLFVGHQAFSQWTVLLMAKTQQLQQSQQLQNNVSAPLMHQAASSAASCV
ncbi:cyclin-domain-containing protein, partial [Chytriomyces cf. hyalinus JEL632]